MTPKQKSKHISDIRAILTSSGLTEDRWGNYKFRSNGTNYRIKIMANNCRCERKAAGRDIRWITAWSVPIVRIELNQLKNWLYLYPPDK